MPEISVIMSVYNSEDTILSAVNSILAQTYDNFELIICNDGSTDDTGRLLEKLAKKDKRVTLLISEQNEGSAKARNKCLSIATGNYVAIMDADDSCDPFRLEKQMAFINENPNIAFVGTKGRYFNNQPSEDFGGYWYCAYPQKTDFLMTLPFVHASILFRSEALKQVGGYNTDSKNIRSEDYELLMRMYAKGYKGTNINEILYYIRQNSNTYKKRMYRYRLNESIVKLEGFRKLGLMPKGFFYAVKPLIVGLIPIRFLNRMKRQYYKNK